MITRIRSDAWDDGNSLTHWFECSDTCWQCGGVGLIDSRLALKADGIDAPNQRVTCPECGGKGWVSNPKVYAMVVCPNCGGAGRVYWEE